MKISNTPFYDMQPAKPAFSGSLGAPQKNTASATNTASADNPHTQGNNDSAAPKKHRFAVARTAGTLPVWQPKPTAAAYAPDGTPILAAPQNAFESGFKTFIDAINPLQHIPLVATIYRKITGDEISAPARVAGGTLYGGPIGGALALADVAIKQQTGTAVEDKVLGLVSSDSENKTGLPDFFAKPRHRFDGAPRTAGTMPVWASGNNILPNSNPSTGPLSFEMQQELMRAAQDPNYSKIS